LLSVPQLPMRVARLTADATNITAVDPLHTSVTSLDLASNRITSIAPAAFDSVSTLIELYVQESFQDTLQPPFPHQQLLVQQPGHGPLAEFPPRSGHYRLEFQPHSKSGCH
jgi:hypothetical protein